MAPVAYGVLADILGTVAISAMIGALIGTVVWRFRYGLVLGCLGVLIWLFVGARWAEFRWLPFSALCAPVTILTLLTAYMSARALTTRARWNPWWASVVALVGGLVVGLLYMLVFRSLILDGWEKLARITLAADLGLAFLAVRVPKSVPRHAA